MITLEKARQSLGKHVIYSGGYPKQQKGFIKSVNDTYVFVAFWNDLQKNGIACHPENITLQNRWVKMSRWEEVINESNT